MWHKNLIFAWNKKIVKNLIFIENKREIDESNLRKYLNLIDKYIKYFEVNILPKKVSNEKYLKLEEILEKVVHKMLSKIQHLSENEGFSQFFNGFRVDSISFHGKIYPISVESIFKLILENISDSNKFDEIEIRFIKIQSLSEYLSLRLIGEEFRINYSFKNNDNPDVFNNGSKIFLENSSKKFNNVIEFCYS